jgi:two-component system, OmpR family, phosphate regulon response regulator OmpR
MGFDQGFAMTADMPHILVVDDDTRLRDLLRKYLSEQGFRVSAAVDAADARAKLGSIAFDLIVLDIMMPGENGLNLTQSLRTTMSVPILLLTAMGEAEDRIGGLEAGADDYLPKPFEPRELVLRIRTILRRVPSERAPSAPPRRVQFGRFAFDLETQRLEEDQRPVKLSGAEAQLLRALVLKLGEPLSREELGRQTNLSGNLRTLDVQVTRLRRKIEDDPKFPRFLQTIRGRGYVLFTDR